MKCDRITDSDTLTKMKDEALKLLAERFQPGLQESDLCYYSYPETFGSTAGPFGGIGGQSITTYQVDAFEWCGAAVLFCTGRYWKIVSRFQITVHTEGKGTR